MRFVDNYNKKVIYTNEHHLITLQFPFILNIKQYFHLFCSLIPSLNWRQVHSPKLIVLLIFQHCVLQLSPIASWNIGTMGGRSNEIVETITRRNVDLCCVHEVRWRGASARHITGKDSRYKFFWVGNNQGTSGVGVLLAEKWVDKVYDIKRVSDRIMLIKLLVGEAVLTVLSVYAPQTGLEESTKDSFYDSLRTVISELPDKEIVIPCGDWNGHVGREAAGYESVRGGSGYGERNADGDRVLEFAVANDFVIGNTFFVKRDSHLIT